MACADLDIGALPAIEIPFEITSPDCEVNYQENGEANNTYFGIRLPNVTLIDPAFNDYYRSVRFQIHIDEHNIPEISRISLRIHRENTSNIGYANIYLSNPVTTFTRNISHTDGVLKLYLLDYKLVSTLTDGFIKGRITIHSDQDTSPKVLCPDYDYPTRDIDYENGSFHNEIIIPGTECSVAQREYTGGFTGFKLEVPADAVDLKLTGTFSCIDVPNPTLMGMKVLVTRGSPTGTLIYVSYSNVTNGTMNFSVLNGYTYYFHVFGAYGDVGEINLNFKAANPCATKHTTTPIDVVRETCTYLCKDNRLGYYWNYYYTHKHTITVPSYVTVATFDLWFSYFAEYAMFVYICRVGESSYLQQHSYIGRNQHVLFELPPGDYEFVVRGYYYNSTCAYDLNLTSDIVYLGECQIAAMAVVDEWYDKDTQTELYNWCMDKAAIFCEDYQTDCDDDCTSALVAYLQEFKPVIGHNGMTPSKHDIEIWRGASFELELISEVKVYTYDPALHHGVSDAQRTHAENLEHYGFTYEYIDFATIYDYAELSIRKPWIKYGQATAEPILLLNTDNGGLELTDNSVRIGINAVDTKNIEFDSGVFELVLIIEEELSQADIMAGATPENKIDKLIYGTAVVLGEK